ncbi:protein VraC [Staphylococcus arlettae]|nr:hypothetical protein [Staphylococcus arlettae]EJY94900.1 hypothetical protein SARL_10316 [Staphylococcus arlettae CVD059]MBF0736691.1 protein VraC [Staphylococcus arlettae]MBK3718946.1 hypothetical protein [Staphylococcus arlettae]MCD8863512.1 protein VraC [Staphylococcus arlettae]MCD8889450.1 protein VraC [Staphylococcus arlettae]
MQYFSNVGSEWQTIYFSTQLVTDYKALVNVKQCDIDEVPPLLCARLWQDFKIFQQFKAYSIALVSTEVTQYYKLKCNRKYKAKLVCKNVKQLKKYTKYTFVLEIYEYNLLCISITQQFIEWGSINASF